MILTTAQKLCTPIFYKIYKAKKKGPAKTKGNIAAKTLRQIVIDWTKQSRWCLQGSANILHDQITETGIQWKSLTLEEILHPLQVHFIPHFWGKGNIYPWGYDWDWDNTKLQHLQKFKITVRSTLRLLNRAHADLPKNTFLIGTKGNFNTLINLQFPPFLP